MKQGKIIEAEAPTVRVDATPTKLTAPPPHNPKFFTDRMPFLPHNQQRQSTEGLQATTYRIENFAGVCYAMLLGYAILIRHVLAQPGVRKVEAGAPSAVGSATRASNFCGVHSVTKAENLWVKPTKPVEYSKVR